MTTQLRSTHQELEERVARRTAELARARDEAERASRSKSTFLSSMSHELRTPMNAILGFGQLLESDSSQPLTPRQRVYVTEIVRAGAHLLELINEVLDLARIESGKMQVSLEPVHLQPLVADCLSLVQPVAREHGITVALASHEACDCWVRADRTRLRQVLLNLLSNAIKYNRDNGEVRLDCSVDATSVRISVSDTGPGLSAEQQQRLFQGFERLDAAKASIEGAGIGLALSKQLVELMSGSIGVDSVVGTGSTFWVRLERALPAALPVPATVNGPTSAPAPLPTRERTVLYIEDNAVNVLLMEAILAQQPGLRLLTASLPGQGLLMARAEKPDLILLDIQLPGMDGFEVLQRLRGAEATRSIPVIAISANAMRGDLERGREAGFADYLTKPLDIQQVLAAVNRSLAGSSQT
jgi:CheY-like chemotaxis protein